VKREHYPRAEVAPIWYSREQDYPVTRPWTLLLEARAGDLISAVVREVSPAAGYLHPDPVMWLIRLNGGGDPEGGEVVAVSDDEHRGLPKLEYESPSPGTFRLVLAPYQPSAAGLASVEVLLDGVVQVDDPATFFGGVLLTVGELSPGDLLFAGSHGMGGGRDHDTNLALLPAPWSGERHYAASNNDLGVLPRLRVTRPMSKASLLVGSFHEHSRPEVRLVISRLQPGADGLSRDGDGDLLSSEVEALLGTCDTVDAASESQCRSPWTLPPDWSPVDTDHDGFTDLEELYGVRRCYEHPGSPPRSAVAGCLKGGDGRCLAVCPAQAAMEASLPLSAMGAPDPTVYDLYIEYDFWHVDGKPAETHAIPDQQVEMIRRAFEEEYRHEGLSTPGGGGFTAGGVPLRFHLYQDDAVWMPELDEMAHIPSLANRSLFFDLFFTPARKYTNTFHYVLGVHKGGGQSDVEGRAAVFGASGGGSRSMKFLHETGHLLGLLHNHDRPNPDHTPFHLSVMSYGFTHTLPPPVDWDGEFHPCGLHGHCPTYFKCVKFKGFGPLCAPDCGVIEEGADKGTHFARFSAGELVMSEESAEKGVLPERGYPRWYLPYLYCYNSAGRANSHAARFKRFAGPHCLSGRCVDCRGDECSIDWNQDGRFETLQDYDVDGDGRLRSNALKDGNDRLRIVHRGRRGLRITSKATTAPFYTGFGGFSAGNVMPYPSVVYERHGGYVKDVTNRCDEADRWSHCRDEDRAASALFRGPASGDQGIETRLPADYCIPLDGGVTLSLRAKPLHINPEDYPAVLFSSPVLRITLEGEPDQAVWKAAGTSPDGTSWELHLTDLQALGRWTRLTLRVDNRKNRAWLVLRRGVLRLEQEVSGVGLAGELCSFAIGAEPSSETEFMGFIDDPMLISGAVKTL